MVLIAGTPEAGQALTADTGSLNGSGIISYQSRPGTGGASPSDRYGDSHRDTGGGPDLDGGIISNNTLSTPRGANSAGVYVLGTFTMSGGNITGNWSIKGNKQPETNEIYSGPP
jgi:hypothetical protein